MSAIHADVHSVYWDDDFLGLLVVFLMLLLMGLLLIVQFFEL